MKNSNQRNFDEIVQRVDNQQLWDFPGGIFPPQHKALSNEQPIAQLELPERLYIPVKQHIGVEGHLVVEPGEYVLKGQPLTSSMNPFAVPIHAPTSGTITVIAPHVSAHPSGLPELSVELEPDGLDKWCELRPLQNYQNLPKVSVLGAICDAGISGMGGAGFPTHIKAAPKKDIEFLLINGIECEPYITSDDRLMREHAWQIRQGIDVLYHLLSPKQVYIAIEDNKPEAIEAMKVVCQENDLYKVCVIPTKYPAGGEKQLIQILTSREVPKHGLPVDVGVIMHNVGTCFAIADAIFSGKPLIQRVVTITGGALKKPGNVWALIGTPISHLLSRGEYHAELQIQPKVIMGGPMMGFTLASHAVPVVKITNCILLPTEQEMPQPEPEQPCIRCSACADACPASLLPQQLFWHSKAKELDKAQDYNLFDCIECGACAYVCPSEIPLVHYYRVAKAEIRHEQEEKQKSDKARERFESRAARLKREQAARDEKHRKAAEARKQSMQANGNNAQDKIAAALARAKAKRSQIEEQSTQQSRHSSALETQPTTTIESKNTDNVAAAIARAKAKKARREAENGQTSTSHESVEDPQQLPSAQPTEKSERVAAAIARAKAKKAQRETENGHTSTSHQAVEDPQQSPSAQPTDKSDRVAAAIARVKANKALREAEKGQTSASASHEDVEDPQQLPSAKPTDKNEGVATAIADPKAHKTQAQDPKQSTLPATGDIAKDQREADAKPAGSAISSAADSPTQNTFAATAQQERQSAALTSFPRDPVAPDEPGFGDKEPNKPGEHIDPAQQKKQRIAVAVAKAKAKKRSSQQAAVVQVTPENEEPSAPSKSTSDIADLTVEQALELKKRRISAAVAKAKAKKAAQLNQTSEE